MEKPAIETNPSCPSCHSRFRMGRWNWGTLTAIGIAVAAALMSGRGPSTAEAQAPSRVALNSHVYRQVQVVWTRMDDTLTEWELKGWETFQVVPIANPNPGSGAPMQVAILFRRPAQGEMSADAVLRMTGNRAILATALGL